MLILPGALPVAPISEQVFVAHPVPSNLKTITAAEHSNKARNETGADTGPHTGKQGGRKAPAFPDPDKPTGPPPTFEANLLETEREKLRAGPERQNDVPKDQKAEKMPAPDTRYQAVSETETHVVDISI